MEEVDSLAYHLARLLAGKEIVAMAWAHIGLSVVLEDDHAARDAPLDRTKEEGRHDVA